MSSEYRQTFGESWFRMKEQSNSMSITFDEVAVREPSNPRMSRENATRYYNKKCTKVFDNLGMKKKIIRNDFEIKLPIVIAAIRKQTNSMLIREANKINKEYLKEVA